MLRSVPELLRHFQELYPYICVDEAQDTSRIQHAIVSLLAGAGGNLFPSSSSKCSRPRKKRISAFPYM